MSKLILLIDNVNQLKSEGFFESHLESFDLLEICIYRYLLCKNPIKVIRELELRKFHKSTEVFNIIQLSTNLTWQQTNKTL